MSEEEKKAWFNEASSRYGFGDAYGMSDDCRPLFVFLKARRLGM